MALSIGTTSSNSSATNATSYTWSHDNNKDSLVVYASLIDNAENTLTVGATYGAKQMQCIGTATTTTSSRTYITAIFLLNGAASGTNNVTVYVTPGVTGFVGGAVSVTGSAYGVSVGATDTNTAGGVISLSSTVANSHIFTAAAVRSNTTPPTFSNEASQTEVYDLASGSATTEVAGVGLYRATTSTGSYSVGATPSDTIGDIAVAVELYESPAAYPYSNLTSGVNNTDATSFSTDSVTPTANALILVSIIARASDGGAPENPTLSGNGLTWVLANSYSQSVNRKAFVYRSMGASPSAGAITIDFGTGNTMTSCIWSVDQFTSVDTTGTNGSGAIVQSVGGGVDGTTFSITLSAFGSANNTTFGAFGASSATAILLSEYGYIPLSYNQGSTGGDNTLLVAYRQANDTSVSATATAGVEQQGVAIEIKYAAGVSTAVKDIIGPGLIPFAR